MGVTFTQASTVANFRAREGHSLHFLTRSNWTRLVLRDSTRGPLRVDVACRRVWVWDGEEAEPRCWQLIVRREGGSPTTIKYTLSNAPAETPVFRLAQMQGQRHWGERVF